MLSLIEQRLLILFLFSGNGERSFLHTRTAPGFLLLSANSTL
jgi:hypothetical protein